ncbi:hypothetical protein AtubIFM57258_002725 [Aspergillus tubingensis]|nr:hypothetical protein AtubIFM57258_002725 [Aspergillus tubingensis]
MSLDPLPNRNPTPPPTLSPSSIRVLVQTLTHLVPSTNQAGDKNIYDDKLFTMLDTICQHTWKCDFDGHVHRCIDKPQILQFEDVQAELKSVPFTPAPYEPSEKPPVRDIVRRRLRSARRIPVRELDHMRDHPEDMEWLERKVRPRFWTNFLEQLQDIEKTRAWEEEQKIMRREFEEEEANQKEVERMRGR